MEKRPTWLQLFTASILFLAVAAHAQPIVVSIVRPSNSLITGAPGGEPAAGYLVTFSEPVSGVDATDFVLTATGTAAATIASVGAVGGTNGLIWGVAVNGFSGDGTLRLDFVDDDTVLSASNIPVGGPGAGNGNFTSGDSFTIDSVVPVVVSVSVPPNGTYGTTDFLLFTVNFSEPVIGGAWDILPPMIAVDIGGPTYAQMISGSGTSSIVFRAGIASGRVDTDGIVLGSTIELPNWSFLRDSSGNMIDPTLNGVPSTAGILVDGIGPKIVSVTAPPAGTYFEGAALDFTVSFDEPTLVLGAAQLQLRIGSTQRLATYVSGSGTVNLIFRYTVQAGDVDPDGLSVGTYIVGNFQDAAGSIAETLVGILQTGVVVAAPLPSKTFSGPSPTGTGTITATFTGGGAGCTFAIARFIPVSGHPASPPAGSAPSGIQFPHGLFDFLLNGCTAGSTIEMTVVYPTPVAVGMQYWKYGPRSANPAPHWYVLPANLGSVSMTFSITDGGMGDDDLAANGTIVDQGGPGIPAGGGPVQTPTLSEWMLAVMAALMLLAALRSRPGATA